MRHVIAGLMFSMLLVGCMPISKSKPQDFIGSQDAWTLVRRVDSQQDSLAKFLAPGVTVNQRYLTRKGSGPVVYGPYQSEPDLSYFSVSGNAKMTVTYHGEKSCRSRVEEPVKCALQGCSWKSFDCSQPAGRVMVDIVMKDPEKGLGQYPLGMTMITVDKAQKTRSEIFAVNGDMARHNMDLDQVELRVTILDDWMQVDLEETQLSAILIRK